jgi:ADP-heptose:LPS heptosyltransferase
MNIQEDHGVPPGAYNLDFADVAYASYNGQHDFVYAVYRRMRQEDKLVFAHKYTVSSIVRNGIQKIAALQHESAQTAVFLQERVHIEEILELFGTHCEARGVLPKEFVESMLLWAEQLFALHYLHEGLHYCERLLTLGLRKYPDFYVRTEILRAKVLGVLGHTQKAQAILAWLTEKPYWIIDRNQWPHIFLAASEVALLNGQSEPVKPLLFEGLRSFYLSGDERLAIVERLTVVYRRAFRVLCDSSVRPEDKALLLLHQMYRMVRNIRLLHKVGVSKGVYWGLLGYVYYLNYGKKRPPRRRVRYGGSTSMGEPHNILVTRAMGGLGDLLMMTPGLHALKAAYPHEAVHLAIPRSFFPLLQGNDDVTLIDIEDSALQTAAYRQWYNLSDCPAARIESRTAPDVKQDRIEIFAQALGIRGRRLAQMERRPRYVVSQEEIVFQEHFWHDQGLAGRLVIGVQPYAAETYRDYPLMEQLVATLSQDKTVLLFHNEALPGFAYDNVLKLAGVPFRNAMALARKCDAIIAPDSFLVHFAGAFDIPCVALFGPIDGHVRTRHYPSCVFLDARTQLGCVPCWRNEVIPCKLLKTRQSPCMRMITVEEICATLAAIMRALGPHAVPV